MYRIEEKVVRLSCNELSILQSVVVCWSFMALCWLLLDYYDGDVDGRKSAVKLEQSTREIDKMERIFFIIFKYHTNQPCYHLNLQTNNEISGKGQNFLVE